MVKILLIAVLLVAGVNSTQGQTRTPYGSPSLVGPRQFYVVPYSTPYIYVPRHTIAPYWFSRAANPYYIYPGSLDPGPPNEEVKRLLEKRDSILIEIDRSIEKRRNLYRED